MDMIDRIEILNKNKEKGIYIVTGYRKDVSKTGAKDFTIGTEVVIDTIQYTEPLFCEERFKCEFYNKHKKCVIYKRKIRDKNKANYCISCDIKINNEDDLDI